MNLPIQTPYLAAFVSYAFLHVVSTDVFKIGQVIVQLGQSIQLIESNE